MREINKAITKVCRDNRDIYRIRDQALISNSTRKWYQSKSRRYSSGSNEGCCINYNTNVVSIKLSEIPKISNLLLQFFYISFNIRVKI